MDNEGTLYKTIHSSKWVVLGNITNKIIGVASLLILARLLDPASYGLIAIVLMVAGIFNRMIVTGFESAVIQRQGNTDKYLDVIWTFNILKSFVIFIVIFIAGGIIADFFHVAEAKIVIQLAGLFTVIPALTPIKNLYLFKEFKFNKLYYRDLAGQVMYVVVGVLYAAFISPDVWALFFANLSKSAFSSLVVYFYFPTLPKLNFNFKILRELFLYSRWITAQNFVNYFLSIIDNVFIGRLMSIEILGFYTKARNLAGIALSLFSNMTKDLGFVAFSKIQNQADKIREGFLMSIDLILFLGLSNIFIFWFAADSLVFVLLGHQWLEIVPALKIFTVFTVSNSILVFIYSLFDGSGKPSINLKLKIFSLILYTVFSYLGIKYKSMVGAAMGVTLSNIIIMLYSIYKLKLVYHISFKNLVKRSKPAILLFLLAIILASLLNLSVVTANHFLIIAIVCSYYFLFLSLFFIFGLRFKWDSLKTVLYVFNTLKRNKI